MSTRLTIPRLKAEATRFAHWESNHREPSLFGVTDGKAVGTYLERKFQAHLHKKFDYSKGSSAKGIDLPDIAVDIKATSIRQPQCILSLRIGSAKKGLRKQIA